MDRLLAMIAVLGLALTTTDANAGPATPPPPPPAKKAQPPAGGDGPETSAPDKPKPPGTAPKAAPAAGSTPPAPGGATPPPPSLLKEAADAEEELARQQDAKPVDLGDTWGYSRRGSIRPRYVRRSTNPILYAPNPIGFYSGVSVQGNQTPPNPVKKTGAPPAVLTWTGFERTPTGSRVFFQLSDAAHYKVSKKGTTITIRMQKTKINVRNNMRRLDLSYFKTPVRSVKVWRKKGETYATILLKRDIEPQVKMTKGKTGSGYKLLVVDFTHRTAKKGAVDRPNVPKKKL